MESDAGSVGAGDHAKDQIQALQLADFKEQLVQGAAQTVAAVVPVQIDGQVGAPGIGSPFKGAAGVGITHDAAVFFGYQVRIEGADAADALRKFLRAGQHVLKGDGSVDVLAVNL